MPQASDVTLTAAARAFNLDARGADHPGRSYPHRGRAVRRHPGKQRVALAQPTTLTVVDGGVDVGTVALGLGSGRLMLSGLAGSHLALKADARAIPLSAVEIFVPRLGVAGALNGSAEISGAASNSHRHIPTASCQSCHLANAKRRFPADRCRSIGADRGNARDRGCGGVGRTSRYARLRLGAACPHGHPRSDRPRQPGRRPRQHLVGSERTTGDGQRRDRRPGRRDD